jgi:hypothetical protein
MEACSKDRCRYRIVVHGHLSGRSAAAFNGLEINLTPEGRTIISGPEMDQSALFGILLRIRDFGIPLLSVNREDLAREIAHEGEEMVKEQDRGYEFEK